MFDVIAFDADDTLWHNERLYTGAQERFRELLAPYQPAERIAQALYETETRNLELYGYGIKSFALSMIEAALDLSGGQIGAEAIRAVLATAREMLSAKVELLDYAAEVVTRLAKTHALMIITKGDLLDQQAKIERSGLGACFRYVEVVTDKTPASYAALLARYRLSPARFLMVGNSLRSDILPVMELGGCAVYVPYASTWAHEAAPPPAAGQGCYHELEHLGLLPDLVERLSREAG